MILECSTLESRQWIIIFFLYIYFFRFFDSRFGAKLIDLWANMTYSGGLRTGTPISEYDFSYNFSHYISRRLHDMDKEVAPQDRRTISLTAN